MKARWLALLLVAGCGGPKPSTENGSEKGWASYGKAVASTPNTRLFSDADLGLAVLLPERLMTFDETPQAQQAVMDAVRKVNPGLGELVYSFGVAGENAIEFIDVAPEALAFGTLGGMSLGVVALEEEFDAKAIAAEAPLGMSSVGQEPHPLGPVLHFSRLTEKETVTKGRVQMQNHLYLFGREKAMWAVQFDYPTDLAAEMKPVVKGILDSIRLSKPDPDSLAKRLAKWREEVEANRRRDEQAERDRVNAEAEAEGQRQRSMEERYKRGLEPPPGPTGDAPQKQSGT